MFKMLLLQWYTAVDPDTENDYIKPPSYFMKRLSYWHRHVINIMTGTISGHQTLWKSVSNGITLSRACYAMSCYAYNTMSHCNSVTAFGFLPALKLVKLSSNSNRYKNIELSHSQSWQLMTGCIYHAMSMIISYLILSVLTLCYIYCFWSKSVPRVLPSKWYGVWNAK